MSNSVIDFPWKKLLVTGTDQVFTGRCVLHSLVFNGMTTVGTLQVLDGTALASTQIGLIYLTGVVQVSCQPITLEYDCEMDDGIRLVFANLVGNVTVMYY